MIKTRIAITTGDSDGVGLEVATKAISLIQPKRNLQLILWRDKKSSNSFFRETDLRWKRFTVPDLDSALKIGESGLIDIASSSSPTEWVIASAKSCLSKKLSGMATGPLSKKKIIQDGYNYIGHTEILKKISGAKFVNMGFLGEKFNVVLASDHVPLSKLSKKLSADLICSTLINADRIRPLLSGYNRNRPIGILGLNPHAGEGGLLGRSELLWKKKIFNFAKKHRIPVEFPLVPDAAFLEKNWNRYSFFLALYHDQGLIPFKLVHGQDSGVHMTLGIPFIRTSVDHGTAKDIAGKNIANPNSMLQAIEFAIKLARLRG